MDTLQSIQSARRNAIANPAQHRHLFFEVAVLDKQYGDVMRAVRWWKPGTADHLADAAFANCQVQHLLNKDATRAIVTEHKMNETKGWTSQLTG